MIFSKRGQMTILIIIAVIIIGVVLFFVFRGKDIIAPSTDEFEQIYTQYDSCIEQETRAAIDVAGSQGGRIYIGEYITGSDYMPFSSHLNFLGNAVPYWYYISGNGIVREQVPSKIQIEGDIAKFVEEGIKECDFSNLYADGFEVKFGTPKVKVGIEDEQVIVDVSALISSSKGNNSATKSTHQIVVPSEFGKFYSTALRIYKKELNESFLEKYAEDVLRLYAPVDGVELSCSPKVWKAIEVSGDIKSGLEANIAHLKLEGDYYSLANETQKYFVVNEKTDVPVNFIYQKSWPTKVSIAGTDGGLMIAKPIGNQAGMGMMGFCYAPYHFVYDLSFPVMVQLYSGSEIFQFPVAVVIDKNLARNALPSSISEEESFDLCNFNAQDITVNVYDSKLNSANANISYTCFDQECRLGETQEGVFSGSAPSCLNGYLTVRADGFVEKKQIFSTNKEKIAEIIIDKEYPVGIEVRVDDKPLSGNAIISFEGDRSVSTSLPENPKLSLSEGLYNVSVYVYGNSSIVIPASTKRQCTTVETPGFFGMFGGGSEEQCYDINMPETKIESALTAGGKSEAYLLPEMLGGGKLVIRVNSFSKPDSLEKLQYNYESFENAGVVIDST